MSGTKTADKKAEKKAQNKAPKADKQPKAQAPVNVEPKGEAVENAAGVQAGAVATDVQATKRTKKNATQTRIDPANPDSGRVWLGDFYKQCDTHKPAKGYDQHWNSEGFIHSGPATRLPNAGAANMVTLIGDILAKRQMAGDSQAGEYLDYCINFLTTHRQALQDAREADILAQAEAIKAKQNA